MKVVFGLREENGPPAVVTHTDSYGSDLWVPGFVLYQHAGGLQAALRRRVALEAHRF